MKTRRQRRRKPRAPAIAIPFSENRKTGHVAVTYSAQGSCPVTCPLMDKGCYAEFGPTGIITKRLNKAAKGMTPEEIASAEAIAIDALPALADMRLHAVGDCRTSEAAARVAAAATRYVERGKGRFQVWTYTHAWRLVDRASWAGVSVLASVESWDDVERAFSRGYAVAIVVADFENAEACWSVMLEDGPVTVVPCLYQTKDIQCVDCRLCLDDGKLRDERRVIAFQAHGARRSTVVKSLEVLNG